MDADQVKKMVAFLVSNDMCPDSTLSDGECLVTECEPPSDEGRTMLCRACWYCAMLG